MCKREPIVSPKNTHVFSLLVEGCGNGKLRRMIQKRTPIRRKYEVNTMKTNALATSMVFSVPVDASHSNGGHIRVAHHGNIKEFIYST